MLTVKGTYDGKTLKLLKKVFIKRPKSVLVTFLDDSNLYVNKKDVLRNKAFDFLDDPDEDIYTDDDLKVKY